MRNDAHDQPGTVGTPAAPTEGGASGEAAWIDVAALEALDPDFPMAVEAGGHAIGLYLHEGAVHALENICPHAHAILTEGFQENGLIECPLHSARFEISTGLCLDDIGQRDLTCHAARVRNGRVEVKLASPTED